MFVATLVGAGIALVLQQINVSLKVQVVGADLKFYEYDEATEITLIDFGTLERGAIKTMPSSQFYWLKNEGNQECYVHYEFNAPNGITMTLKDQLSGEEIAQGTVIYAPPYENYIRIQVICEIGNATALGTYEAPNFTLTIYATDSAGP